MLGSKGLALLLHRARDEDGSFGQLHWLFIAAGMELGDIDSELAVECKMHPVHSLIVMFRQEICGGESRLTTPDYHGAEMLLQGHKTSPRRSG